MSVMEEMEKLIEAVEELVKKKQKTFTVHFLQPVITWDDVKAESKEAAICSCTLGQYDYDQDTYGQWVAIEEEK